MLSSENVRVPTTFIYFKELFVLFEWMFCMHAHKYNPCLEAMDAKRGHLMPWKNGIVSSCEPSCGLWEMNQASLQEHVLTELSLQPLFIYLFVSIIFSFLEITV